MQEKVRGGFSLPRAKKVAFTIDTNQRHELRERGGQRSEAAKLHLVSIIDSFPFACSGITLVHKSSDVACFPCNIIPANTCACMEKLA